MKLSVGERIKILGLLQGYKGALIDLRVVKEMTDAGGISEEDFKKYKIRSVGSMLVWDEKVEDADIDIGGRGKAILVEILMGMEGRKELTVDLLPLWDLIVEVK